MPSHIGCASTVDDTEPSCFALRAARMRHSYLNESISACSHLFNSWSRCLRDSILLTECKTVVWCLFPNSRPMRGSERPVNFLQRYMPIWRGTATDFELFFDFNSCTRI